MIKKLINMVSYMSMGSIITMTFYKTLIKKHESFTESAIREAKDAINNSALWADMVSRIRVKHKRDLNMLNNCLVQNARLRAPK